SQLPQKYQERLLARRRGLGTPKTELRSFKIIVSSGNETPESTESISETVQQPDNITTDDYAHISPIRSGNQVSGNETPESTESTSETVQQPDNIMTNDYAYISPIRSGNQAMPMSWSSRIISPNSTKINRLQTTEPPQSVNTDNVDLSSSMSSTKSISNTDSEEEPSGYKNRRVKRTVTRLNECNVVGNVINDTIEEFLDELDDNKFSKEFQYFKKEVELRLIEQSDLVDEHIALQSSLQKAKSRIRQLRTELLNVQRHHDKVYSELHKERSTFRMDEENRKKLEQIHTFLSDLELLRISVMSRDSAQDMEEDDEVLDGFEGLLASVTSRCCDVSNLNMIFQSSDSIRITDAGNLGVLRRFNSLLE
ncbi:10512_t:CDS:2, partial [Gigaspora rosea]